MRLRLKHSGRRWPYFAGGPLALARDAISGVSSAKLIKAASCTQLTAQGGKATSHYNPSVSVAPRTRSQRFYKPTWRPLPRLDKAENAISCLRGAPLLPFARLRWLVKIRSMHLTNPLEVDDA
jgi:hypothetical protein